MIKVIRVSNKKELIDKMFRNSIPVGCGMCDDNGFYCCHSIPGSCGQGGEDYSKEVVAIGNFDEKEIELLNRAYSACNYMFIIDHLDEKDIEEISKKDCHIKIKKEVKVSNILLDEIIDKSVEASSTISETTYLLPPCNGVSDWSKYDISDELLELKKMIEESKSKY